jgi:hypothetical protein
VQLASFFGRAVLFEAVQLISGGSTEAAPGTRSTRCNSGRPVNRSLTNPCHAPYMAELVTPSQFLDLEHPTVLRALLRHIVEHADCNGIDACGRPVLRFEFACEHWLLDKLAALGAGEEDLEPDDHLAEDSPAEDDDPKEDIDAVLA